jgi:Tfp pilus assembly protein PilN
MQIQINLLPGARKPARGGGAAGLATVATSLRERVADPWLVGSAGAVVAAVAAVGLLFTTQQARAGELEARLERVVRDSTRYATVLAARRKLAAERDSVERQIRIIRTIDDNRYTWAHILDEVSRALPAYTWLTALEQTSKAPLPPGADTLAGRPEPRPRRQAAKGAAADSVKAPRDTVNIHPELAFRLVGQTVDIQALTMFMRQLESSPFIQKVSLKRSEIVVADGKDVTEFELDAQYEVPPPGIVRTTPLVVPVR